MTSERLVVTIVACAAVLFANCSGKRQPLARLVTPPLPAEAAPPPPPPAFEPASESKPALTEEEFFARKSLDELNAERPLADVFFDYDQVTIREDGREVLQQNAAWLRRWTSTRIIIEGHCDARGTSEYNLALGERRARSVREYLAGLGVRDDRIVVISKGEEAPLCNEQAEACWQQNRRATFAITAK